MIGIDLGISLGSVTVINLEGKPHGRALVKPSHYKDGWDRRIMAAWDYYKAVRTFGVQHTLAIEEPVYSWGRRNPKVFADSVILMTLVRRLLEKKGYKVIMINNQSAKRVAGTANIRGRNKKLAMIRAYEKKTVKFSTYQPLTGAKKNQETLADSYFIALAGLKELSSGKVRTKKI